MKITDWGAFFAKRAIPFADALKKALADWKADKPLPPRPPASSADIVAGARAAQPILAWIVATADAHPGDVQAIDDLLDFFKTQGAPAAGPLENAVNAAPGFAEAALTWLPDLIGVLGAIAPTPAPLPGMGPRVGRG